MMESIRRKIFRIAGYALAVVLAAAVLIPSRSNAIPAFARKYRMSCTTCHAPVPRLKAYGDEFAGNAFRMEDDQEPTRYTFDTGDDLLMLMRELPLAVRFDAFVSQEYVGDGKRNVTDLKTPYGLKLMSGGNLSKKIGYYFYFYMSEQGEVAGVEDAYLHFNNLLGIDLDLIAGQFQVSDPLFKRELRLTYEDYEIYKVELGYSPTSLTYDRGFMLTYGASAGFDAVLELLNGNGKGQESEGGYFDEDNWKNVMLRLSQQVRNVRLGAFGYYGRDQWSDLRRNDHYYWGVDGTLDIGENLQINGQYLERTDENPLAYIHPPGDVKVRGGMVELVWLVRGQMGRPFVTLLYNRVDPVFDSGEYPVQDFDELDYNSGTVSFSYLLRRNMRLLVEGTYEDVRENYRFVAGVVSAF